MEINVYAYEVRVGDIWNGRKVISVSQGKTVLITLQDASPNGRTIARDKNDILLVKREIERITV